jgi:hypothetical protein
MDTKDRGKLMTTEQQIKSAIDTLNEALELMKELGLLTEGDEDETL